MSTSRSFLDLSGRSNNHLTRLVLAQLHKKHRERDGEKENERELEGLEVLSSVVVPHRHVQALRYGL